VSPAEAKLLVAALAAAFPHPRVPEATVTLYCEQLARLDDADAARAAVEVLIANEERFPPVAVILREYRSARRWRAQEQAAERARGRGLAESPPLDLAENACRARELLVRLEHGMAERAADGGLTDWQSSNGEADA
jgi:hypothetical protein